MFLVYIYVLVYNGTYMPLCVVKFLWQYNIAWWQRMSLLLRVFASQPTCWGWNALHNPGQRLCALLGDCARLQSWLFTTDTSCPCTKNWELKKAVSEPVFGFTGKAFIVIDGNCIMCLKKKWILILANFCNFIKLSGA